VNLKELSPKVYVPVIFAVLAAVALWLLTGDKSFLVSILVTLAAGGAGVAAKPAPLLTQREVSVIYSSRPRPAHRTRHGHRGTARSHEP
jgi:hypothetical protein